MVNYSRKRSCMPPFCYLPQINISKNDHACHPFVICLKLKSGYLSEINIRGHQNVLPFCHLVNLYSRICWRFLHCSVLAETSRREPPKQSPDGSICLPIYLSRQRSPTDMLGTRGTPVTATLVRSSSEGRSTAQLIMKRPNDGPVKRSCA